MKSIPINLTALFTGICSACLIGIGTFLFKMKEDLPLMKDAIKRVESNQNVLQNSFNGMSIRFTSLSDEQIRQAGDIYYIKEKIKK